MSNIWFSSDFHGYHKNISGPKISQWKSGYRNFDDEIQMTEHIINNINKYVKHDDILYFLGDWTFNHPFNVKKLRDQINCQNIHFIYGNHDKYIRDNKGIITEHGVRKPHDCFKSLQDVLTVKHGQHTFFMSHYSHQVWNGSHKGVIHLFGHSHATLKGIGKSMDVGIDNAYKLLKEYRPFSIEEIISYMDKIDIKYLDHHNKETNE